MHPPLLGLETEYALRFTPSPGDERPSNRLIYDALIDAIGVDVPTCPGTLGQGRPRIFTAYGGTFCYESLPYAPHGGLIEGGTPECADPESLLLYQRVQDHTLERARQRAEATLNAQGFSGTLGILKNCRDAEGHVYGAQENYDATLADGAALWAYRAGLALLSPLLLVMIVALWTLTLTLTIGLIALYASLGLVLALLAGLIPPLGRALGRLRERPFVQTLMTEPEQALGKVAMYFEMIFMWPLIGTHGLLMRQFAFRRIRKWTTGFLISRPIITGAGTLMADGTFQLSEKGTVIRRAVRTSVHPDNRPLFDTGNLMKGMALPFLMQFRPYLRLFHRRQRLQLGLSDSNMAHTAEHLKISLTALVMALAEAGDLDGAPEPLRPIEALRIWSSDPSLQSVAPCRVYGADRERGGAIRAMSALEVQRAFHRRAQEALEAGRLHVAHANAIDQWGATLETLGRDPQRLFGQLDWITKRHLIERAGVEAGPAGRKKIDLRYHELGEGHYALLAREGLCPTLVPDELLELAAQRPPRGTPASARGRLVQALSGRDLSVSVSWHLVRIGGAIGGRVIWLTGRRGLREQDLSEALISELINPMEH